MGFFNKILVQETKTGNLTDITNLDRPHYESFLDAMERLRIAYKVAIERRQNADTGTSKCTIDSVMPRFLPIEEVAKLYGQSISYKWLSPDGNDWLDKKGKVTANTIREMEQGSIKDVLNGA